MLVASTAALSPVFSTSTANMSTPTDRARPQELSPSIPQAATGRLQPGVAPVPPSRDGADDPF